MTDPDAHQAISAAEVQRIARLARLELSPDRVQSLTHDLAKVVAYVDRVRELDLANVEPMTHVGDAANRLAPDEPGRVLETEVLTRMAPAHDGPFVQVPKILDDHGGGA